MTKRILPVFMTCLLGATASQAQITVTGNDLKFGVDTDIIYTIDVDTSGVSLPSAGNDQWWDYGNLVPVDSAEFSFAASDQNPPFTSSTAMMPLMSSQFGEFELQDQTQYFTQAASGFLNEGYHIPYHWFELANPNDTLKIPEQDVEVNGYKALVPFDLTSGTNETGTGTEIINFTLTYQAGGMVNEPGYLKRTRETTHEVTGWGSVILPVSKDTVEALLLKSSSRITDSVFIGGMPVPAALLTGTGLSQGMVTHENMIQLVAKDFNTFAGVFSLNSTGDVAEHIQFVNSWHYDEDTTTAIGKITYNTIRAYPNPASDVLNIETDRSQPLYAEIYSISGRMIGRMPVTGGQIRVGTLNTGTYTALFKNDKEKTVGVLKFVKE